MCITENSFINCLKGQKSKRMPIWLMRQAGRYLPEYLEIRNEAKDFIDFCLTPPLAAKATLQPLKRFDLDAAILFADILLLPFALGQKVHFEKNHGPKLNALQSREDINALQWDKSKIAPVYETIRLTRKELPQNKALIGFSGSPWTVACYMIDGKGGNFIKSQDWVKNKKDDLKTLLSVLTTSTVTYLKMQIEAGVDAVQLFDSHAGLLVGDEFEEYVISPSQSICTAIQKEYPNIPIIGFPRGAKNEDYKAYAQKTGVNALSLDQHVSLKEAQTLQEDIACIQGNLDPELLLKGGDEMKEAARKIVDSSGPHHIFNLGHGVIKETPPEHVEALVNFVHSLR